MIGVLARQQVGQQAGAGQPLGDRPDDRRPGGREPPLARPVATAASPGLADVLDDEEAGRAVVGLLADLLADADARPAAAGTGLVRLGQVVLHPLARQVLWQRLPPATGP